MASICALSKWLWLLSSLMAVTSMSINEYSYTIDSKTIHPLGVSGLFRQNSFFSYEFVNRGQHRLVIYKDGRINNTCTFPEQAHATYWEGTSYRNDVRALRLSNNKVVYKYGKWNRGNIIEHNYYVVDFEDCTRTKLDVDGGLYYRHYSNWTSPTNLVRNAAGDDRFDIFTNCDAKGNDICLLRFQGKEKLHELSYAFNVGLKLNERLKIASTEAIDEYVIIGNDDNDVLKVVLFNGAISLRKEVLSLNNISTENVFISLRTVCWAVQLPSSVVHCSQFDSHGELVFNKTVNFLAPVEILYVQHLRPGRALLLTMQHFHRVFVTDLSSVNEAVPFDFSNKLNECKLTIPNSFYLEAREMDGDSVTEYVCRNFNMYIFKHFIVKKSDQK